MNDTATLLHQVATLASGYLDALDTAPAGPTVTTAELRERFGAGPLPERGIADAEVIAEMHRAADGGLVGNAGGRFFGWVIGGSVPAALAADWLATAWDQNAGIYATSPASAIVEEVAARWLLEVFGLPSTAGVGFVTGCQMAHVTCFLAARHALLARRGWNVETKGLQGAPRIRVLSGPGRHGTVDRALRFIGIGTDAIEVLPGDALDRMLPTALAAALKREPDVPTIVLAQAGDINTGVSDLFEAITPIAREAGAWLHVDGAFGLWCAASPATAHLVRGMERADSWATDAHKWLNVPYDSGLAIVTDTDSHRRALGTRASYLTHSDDGRDALDWSPEFSRRARGFAVWAAMRALGRDGIADLVERSCRHAEALVEGLGRLPGVEVLAPATMNQGLVRFVADARDGAASDVRTDAVIARLQRDGEAFFTGTSWHGMRAMRISVSGWRTTPRDVARAVAAVEKVLSAY